MITRILNDIKVMNTVWAIEIAGMSHLDKQHLHQLEGPTNDYSKASNQLGVVENDCENRVLLVSTAAGDCLVTYLAA